MKRLGRGGNNVALLDPVTGMVIRVAMVDEYVDGDNSRSRIIKRGHTVARFLNEEYGGKTRFGPALIEQSGPLIQTRTLDNAILEALDPVRDADMLQRSQEQYNIVRKQNRGAGNNRNQRRRRNSSSGGGELRTQEEELRYMFYVSEVEYLQAPSRRKMLDDPSNTLNQEAFILCWFLITTQQMVGFRHSDIKLDNFGYRNNPGVKNLTFEMPGMSQSYAWQVEGLRRLPVLFDYDYASVNVTRTRATFGTSMYAPPEVLFASYHFSTAKRAQPYIDLAYDWWAIGYMLFEVHVMRTPNAILYTDDYLNNNPELQELDPMYTDSLYLMQQMAYIVHEGQGPPERIRNRYPESLFWDPQKEPLGGKMMKRRFAYSRLSPDQKQLFKRLMAWDPEERTFFGNTHKYLGDDIEAFKRFRRPYNQIDDIGMAFSHPDALQNAVETFTRTPDKEAILNALPNLESSIVQQEKQTFLLLKK